MISEQTKAACYAQIKHKQLPENFFNIVNDIYYPLLKNIMDKKKAGPLLVSINGAQGTGKSTMTSFLKLIIEYETGARVAELSLDDFYLTRTERSHLASEVHPLLSTRGVPGTHDIQLLEKVIDALVHQQPCVIPRFDKAMDDRCESDKWAVIEQPVDIILFEGWCNNSPPQSVDELKQPINALEKNEDAGGIWRQFVNENLIQYQMRIFRRTDMCIMLKAPDFDSVFAWRRLQEKKLSASVSAASGSSDRQKYVMDDAELKRFIQHYERITRYTLNHLPAIADVVLNVAADHSIIPATR